MLKKLFKIILPFLPFIYSQNCIIEVPNNPLSEGLFAPWYVSTDISSNINCSQITTETSVFVEATILDIDNGQFYVYYPLVLDKGTEPAISPVKIVLPKNNIVVLHFGSNTESIKLLPSVNYDILTTNNCVNGDQNTLFGQFAYCNAEAFFNITNNLINNGKIIIPQISKTINGDLCPTIRSFSIVDQDQSDNVLSTYIITNDMKIAQNTAANKAFLNVSKVITNGSDNRLLNIFIGKALECTSFQAPDLLEPVILRSSLALNEIQANVYKNELDALVPANDPMVLVDGQQSLTKINKYRKGVNQPLLDVLNPQNDIRYCQLMETETIKFLNKNFNLLINSLSPDNENNLLNFLCTRFQFSWDTLKCNILLQKSSPITTEIINGTLTCIFNNTQPNNYLRSLNSNKFDCTKTQTKPNSYTTKISTTTEIPSTQTTIETTEIPSTQKTIETTEISSTQTTIQTTEISTTKTSTTNTPIELKTTEEIPNNTSNNYINLNFVFIAVFLSLFL